MGYRSTTFPRLITSAIWRVLRMSVVGAGSRPAPDRQHGASLVAVGACRAAA